jgi:hypothetical protein
MIINSLDELNEALSAVVPNVLLDLAEQIKDSLKQNLKQNWYDKSTPQNYQRSFDLLNSITCSSVYEDGSNGYKVEVYYDISKIKPTGMPVGLFPRHMNITDNEPSNQYLPLWIEEGETSSIHAYEGIEVVEQTTQEWMSANQYLNIFANELRAYGFECIIV